MTDANQLLQSFEPCPFCGGPAETMAGLVGCPRCGCGRRNAASWNTRAAPVLLAEVERLKARVEVLEGALTATVSGPCGCAACIRARAALAQGTTDA